MNAIMIFGTVAHDPDLGQLESGIRFASVKVVTRAAFRGKFGSVVEEEEVHPVFAFADMADKLAAAKSGDQVAVVGRAKVEYLREEGSERVSMNYSVLATQVQVVPQVPECFKPKKG